MDDPTIGPLTTLVWQPPGSAAALRRDGAEVATGGDDGAITLWNVASGRPVRSWQAHHGWVWACTYHPGRDVLVSTGADGMARVWDGLTGALLAEFAPGGQAFHAVGFSPDGELLATFGWPGDIVIWRSTTEPLVAMTGHSGWVSSVVFCPDGAQVVSTGSDGTLRAWDSRTGAQQHIVFRSEYVLPGCVFRPGHNQLITADASGTRLWDATTWSLLQHHDGITADEIAVAPDGRRIAAGGLDGVRLWDVPTGEVVPAGLSDPTGVQWLRFSPDGREVMVRQVESLSWLDAVDGTTRRSATGSVGAQVTSGASDGALLVTGGQDGRVRIWDLDRGALRHTVDAHAEPVLDLVVRGDLIVSVGAEGVVCVIDAVSGEFERGWTSNELSPRRCFLRPGGEEVLLAGGQAGVGIWRLADAVPLGRVLPEVYQVFDAVVTPDGRELVLGQGADGIVGVWDLRDGRRIGRCGTDDQYPSSAALSPDGTLAVTCDHDGPLRWWDVAEHSTAGFPAAEEPRLSDAGLPGATVCVFAADGRELLTGHRDGQVVAWDAATGRVDRRFDGQYGQVGFCAYSPDGATVLAGGTDRSTRMWDAVTTEPLGFRFEALPDGEAVTWAVSDGTLVDRSPGAARWLGRSVVDPDTATSRWVPYDD